MIIFKSLVCPTTLSSDVSHFCGVDFPFGDSNL